jgi:hypothetical protein
MESEEELEKRIREELKPFREHQEICDQCRFFPISPACYQGAKIANPKLALTKEEYLARIEDLSKGMS